jgi:hypothetical protein
MPASMPSVSPDQQDQPDRARLRDRRSPRNARDVNEAPAGGDGGRVVITGADIRRIHATCARWLSSDCPGRGGCSCIKIVQG